MAKKTTGNKAAVKKQLSKGARHLSVVAPLAALLAEEVRAAQIDTVPTLDLSVFDVQATPEVVQDLAVSEEVDAEFAAALDQTQVDAILADAELSSSGNDRLLLAQAVTDDRAAASIASDSGNASVAASSSTAAAGAEAFELSGLPAVAAVGSVTGATAAAAVTAAAVAGGGGGGGGGGVNAVDVTGTALTTSLSDLQTQGVNAVNTTQSSLHVDAGALTKLTGLPLFGDKNKDGLLSQAEKNALDVTLNVTSQAQLNSLLSNANLGNLSAAGVDHLHLGSGVTLSDAQLVTMHGSGLSFSAGDDVTLQSAGRAPSVASATGTTLGHEVSTLVNLGVDHIDMQNPGSLYVTQAEAEALSAAHINFAANDNVTVTVQGASDGRLGLTSNQIASLHAQGVDHIDMAASAASLGSVSLTSTDVTTLTTAGLSFAANDYVVFDAANPTQLTTALTDQLHTLGVDHVNLPVASQAAFEHMSLNQLSQLGNATATIDMGSNHVELYDATAYQLSLHGVNFAAADDVTALVQVDDPAYGTHMASSLADLHKAGVDHVGVAGVHTSINVDLGQISLADLQASHPVFNANVHVTLNMTQDQATAFGVQNNAQPQVFSDMHIEHINITQGVSVSAAAPTPVLMQALHDSGLASAIAAPATATVVSDDLAASIASQGMASTLASAEAVVIQAPALAEVSESQALKTSLQDIADVQAHAVESEATKVYVELGDNVNVDTLVSQLETNNTSLFADGQQAGLVVGQATFDAMTPDQISQLVGKLSDLGFTEVDVLNGQGTGQAYAIDATSQTLVTSQVEVLGAADAQALVDAFGQDILDPKQA